MQPQLTERQNQIYEFVRSHLRDEGIPPTVDEIRLHLGLVSTNGVHKHLMALERKGAIIRTPGVSRGIRLPGTTGPGKRTRSGPPRLGLLSETLHASQPDLLHRTKESVFVDLRLIPHLDPDAGFVGYVDDGGMADDGIHKDDYVVIEDMGSKPIPEGSLVAVIVEDSLLVRRMSFKGSRVVFTPSARHYKVRSFMAGAPVYLVVGPVRAVMRAL
ncbi:MAG: hypothetical protein AAF791_04210 [Bacteroidota bacterium]